MFFRLDPAISEKNEDICIGVVIAEGVDNTKNSAEIGRLLLDQVKSDHSGLEQKKIRDMEYLAPYHRGMESLGVNPSKYSSSIEALLNRVSKKGECPQIHPVVDLGNFISLKYKIPVGVHDRDSFNGDLAVRFSNEADITPPNSGADFEDFAAGEPVYAVGNTVRTRRWIWRQTEAGRVTDKGRSFVFPMDGFSSNRETILKAGAELAVLLEQFFGCTVRLGMLDKEHPSMKISDLDETEREIENAIKIMLKGVAEHTAVNEIREKLLKRRREQKPMRVKLGLDPTAPDIHLGHSVVLRKIRQLQDLGHRAVIIIGDFTGRIGDPSGKSKTRNQLTGEEIKKNAKTYEDQIFKILDPNNTEICFNSDWLGVMNFADVIKLTAAATVARILEREDFKNRYVKNQPIGMHEFLYPFLQAYDSVVIKADIELGGTDQTFNILFGRDIQRSYGDEPQITLFMPLLEGIDGKEKMSKSLGNYIGINEGADIIFEKVMKIPDSLIIKYYNLCTDLHPGIVARIEQRLASGENPRDIKMELALEITGLYCGEEKAGLARLHFIQAYQQNIAPDEIKPLQVAAEGSNPGEDLINAILTQLKYKYKSEIRTLFNQGAVSINKIKIKEPREISSLKDGDILQIGKNKFYKIIPIEKK